MTAVTQKRHIGRVQIWGFAHRACGCVARFSRRGSRRATNMSNGMYCGPDGLSYRVTMLGSHRIKAYLYKNGKAAGVSFELSAGVMNPHRYDSTSPLRELGGATVTFMFESDYNAFVSTAGAKKAVRRFVKEQAKHPSAPKEPLAPPYDSKDLAGCWLSWFLRMPCFCNLNMVQMDGPDTLHAKGVCLPLYCIPTRAKWRRWKQSNTFVKHGAKDLKGDQLKFTSASSSRSFLGDQCTCNCKLGPGCFPLEHRDIPAVELEGRWWCCCIPLMPYASYQQTVLDPPPAGHPPFPHFQRKGCGLVLGILLLPFSIATFYNPDMDPIVLSENFCLDGVGGLHMRRH